MVLPSHECWSDTPRGFCRCCHGYGTELMSALLLMLLTMLQLGVDGTAAVAVVLDVKLMSVSAELIVLVLIQVLMMSVWAQVHGQVLMCMPVCAIGTDDSGDKFMKIFWDWSFSCLTHWGFAYGLRAYSWLDFAL